MYPTSYLSPVMDLLERTETVNRSLKKLRYEHRKNRFHALVVTGISGLMVGPEISRRMGVELIVIRKDEGTHSPNKLECSKQLCTMVKRKNILSYSILDDFISSGVTVRRITHMMHDAFPDMMIRGFYGWYHHEWLSREDLLARCSSLILYDRGNPKEPEVGPEVSEGSKNKSDVRIKELTKLFRQAKQAMNAKPMPVWSTENQPAYR